MRNQRVPKHVYRHMVQYYNYLWTYNKGVPTNSLFVDLPEPMRAEIAVAVTIPMWSKVSYCASAAADLQIWETKNPAFRILSIWQHNRGPLVSAACTYSVVNNSSSVFVLHRVVRKKSKRPNFVIASNIDRLLQFFRCTLSCSFATQ